MNCPILQFVKYVYVRSELGKMQQHWLFNLLRNSNLKIVKISMPAIPAIMCVLLLYQIQKNPAKIFEKYFITSFQK